MSETLGSPEFTEQLPKSAEFDRSRKMANLSAEIAEATRAQLEAEVDAKNTELEAKGLVGSEVEFETTEEFAPTDEGYIYNFYGGSGTSRTQHIAGRFNGLSVLDTRGVAVNNKSGFKLRGIEPDRFVVCALVDASEYPDAQTLVPLRGIETPLLPRETWDDLLRTA